MKKAMGNMGILATTELAEAAGLEPSTHVLDFGCGLGGPARYLAATFGCKVTGVDLAPASSIRQPI
jgi:cyclopropane fatty-acyl-phospholipid synthase-like methyltransferase